MVCTICCAAKYISAMKSPAVAGEGIGIVFEMMDHLGAKKKYQDILDILNGTRQPSFGAE